jgi:hypothetical protein
MTHCGEKFTTRAKTKPLTFTIFKIRHSAPTPCGNNWLSISFF